jgi:uncharacterized damage-inducible protein DinB
MRIFTITVAVVCAMTIAIPTFAQTTSTADPIAGGVRQAWNNAKRNLTRSAELMPEGDYAFRPVATVRTFGQILAHVAGANYVFCSAAKGEKSPHAEDAFEKSATTRAQIIKALNDSIAYCDSAYTALDDKRAGEVIELPFGMGKGARALPLMLNTGHLQEHYGNLVTYFRVKGMVPPSSQGQ